MTNEEMIKAMFPDVEVIRRGFRTEIRTQKFMVTAITDWLDAPYENKTSIKALEQQPCEDCVSRQSVIELLDSIDHVPQWVFDRFAELPSVTPQPKVGHWISHREHCEELGVMPSGLGAYEWCSNCDCGIDVNEFHRNHYNFCPCCGADMRESGGEK